MPRYFFDIDDGTRKTRDEQGLELENAEAARRAAIAVLPDLAREELPDGNQRVFICQARSTDGTVIFVATLSLIAQWVGNDLGGAAA